MVKRIFLRRSGMVQILRSFSHIRNLLCTSHRRHTTQSRSADLCSGVLCIWCLLIFVLTPLRLLVNLPWNDLHSAPCCLDLLASTRRELMGAHGEGEAHFAIPKHLDQSIRLSSRHYLV